MHSMLSALGKRDEKEDEFDPLETLAAKSYSNATVDPAIQFEQGEIVAIVEHGERRALGVTVEGVPIELVVAPPERFGTELVRATGMTANAVTRIAPQMNRFIA